MISVLKTVLRRLGLFEHAQRGVNRLRTLRMTLLETNPFKYVKDKVDVLRSYRALPKGSTMLIHVGKCGGGSLREGLEQATRNADVHTVHVKKPVYRKDLSYIVLLRDPLARLVSAFDWRYRLVEVDGSKRAYDGEHEVLTRDGGLNGLGESLYKSDGTLNKAVHRDLRRVGHVRKGIPYYLRDLLRKCDAEQIVAVLMQETLDDDIYRVFGYRNEKREHSNPQSGGKDQGLTDVAAANLRRWLAEDYEILMKLCCWGKIEQDVLIAAISGEDGRAISAPPEDRGGDG